MKKSATLISILIFTLALSVQALAFGRGDRPPARSLQDAMDSGKEDTGEAPSCLTGAITGSRKGDSAPDLTLETAKAFFEDGYLNVNFEVEGNVTGGTVKPPDVNVYVMEIVPSGAGKNGTVECIEWMYIPSVKENGSALMPPHEGDMKEYVKKVRDTGVMVLKFIMEDDALTNLEYVLDAEAETVVSGKQFAGKIKIPAPQSLIPGKTRLRIFTMKNFSIEAFTPIVHDSKAVKIE